MLSAELGSELERYVTELVAKGRYGSKSEVLREGVRMVQDREQERAFLAAILDGAVAESEIQPGLPAGEVFDRLARKYAAMARS